MKYVTEMKPKDRLEKGRSISTAALKSDPFALSVKLEVASPEEIKSSGKGWTIRSGFAASPFGPALVAVSPRGICNLSFLTEESSEAMQWSQLQNCWPQATLSRDDEMATSLIRRIFDSPLLYQDPLTILVKGTPF